jgi:myo-inositol-1(or 4)-monophosphatase
LPTLPAGSSGRTAFEVAEATVREAGKLIMEWFGALGGTAIIHKGRSDIVTEADTAVEAAALAMLRQEFPGFGVLAEESGASPGSPYTWVLDPIDGTRNFANGVPHFAVNLALIEGADVLLGLTYDPVRNELFHAEAGQGAFLNGQSISVSSTESLEMSILGFDMGYVDQQATWLLQMIEGLWPGMQAVRVMGSAALGLAYAAAGRIDMYTHHHLGPWDLAPGLLLVREAGGVVTDLQGPPATLHGHAAIAANPVLHARFMAATAGTPWRRIR